MNHLSKKQLQEKILELEKERAILISLYIASDNLIKDSKAYITDLLTTRMELEEEIKNLKSYIKTPFSAKDEFEKIKLELRKLEENKKGENPDNWRKEI
ncbi:hypothetical protein CP963_09185 [Arcobacter cloacae]|uniref:Uncharacterized protein n=1 Tax=Arcobacter cloacae TaxID=1054034 RepID=A0A6M8NL98_9BACT|nr:hypothetical protein ACLO_1477 [Arcobacter cloacae]RXI40245.1 hypothetical protein CP963_09185 [Arcobacter cloacae]